MPYLRKCSQLCAGQVSDLTAVLSCKDNGIRDRRRLNASAERENPAREEVRRAFDPDRQLGGGGLPIPRWNWEEECSTDRYIIMLRCSIFRTENEIFSG
ncbi:hypothetical protein CN227_01195 [Sinorhizobium meliloti]|nr:hypothetical protein CN240_08935 [Sinorhizobium meliloti]RVG50052.1 hypothetical protein CN227_01195 [Sinorhizobium meliloti]